MDYYLKDFKDHQEDNDTEYLLKDKTKLSQTNPQSKLTQIENLHDPLSIEYDQQHSNDLLHLKDNKEIEITPILKEDYTLLTLNNISHCQSCKDKFNSKRNAPYLLPCNHFFCKKCIEGFSIGSYSINCPIDGKVANSFSELSLLSNLLNKNEVIESIGDNCIKHPNQQLTHFVEETKEVICVYCAFNLMKTNPQNHIKEIDEKCSQLTTNLDQILENNQQYAEGLQGALDVIKKNKELVDEQIIQIYDKVIIFVSEKKENLLKKCETIFSENALALSEKLDFFSGNIELAEKLKEELLATKNTNSFSKVVDKYDSVINDSYNNSKLMLEYHELHFTSEDEKKMFRTMGTFTQLMSQRKIISFGEKNKIQTIQSEQMTEANKRKKYQDEMYIETMNDKPPKQYLVPDAICRTSGSSYGYSKQYEQQSLSSSSTYLNPQQTKPKPKQYIASNNSNINSTANIRNTPFVSKSQIGSRLTHISGNQNNGFAYDYQKKRDLSFDKNE